MWLPVFFVVLFIRSSNSFSVGAGTTACSSLTPNHGANQPQDVPSPVTITASGANVIQGQVMTFVIEGINPNYLFRGFLAQAQTLAETPVVVGNFDVTEGMRILNCAALSPNSVATHTSSDLKSRIELTWVAPTNYAGIIQMQ